MRYTALLLSIVSLLAFASDTNAQEFSLSTTFDGDREISTLSFPAPANQGWGVWEVRPRATSAAQCLAVTDFTNAVPADPDHVTLALEPGTSTFFLRNTNSVGLSDSCGVLIVRSTDGRDYVVWRKASYGQSSLADQAILSDKEGDSATTQRTRQTSFAVTFSTQTF